MSDQVRISFDDDGTLVIDTRGLDERLREQLFQRGNVVVDGDKVKVQILGPLPWDPSIPVDVDCACRFGPIANVPVLLNLLCACGGTPSTRGGGGGDPTI